MKNLLEDVEIALIDKTFKNGLSYYSQSNCTCSLTADGYRIYRTPNVNPTDNGYTMWGGFIIRNFTNQTSVMIKGHRYVLKFDIKGISDNGLSSIGWTNQAGWGGAGYGLGTNPTVNLVKHPVKTNFNSKKYLPFIYDFTITDDIFKTCTTSYSGFVAGNSYNTYRDFLFGFGYSNTGANGTDIYIRNIRMYDITNADTQSSIANKNGLTKTDIYVEDGEIASISKYKEILSPQFYEY